MTLPEEFAPKGPKLSRFAVRPAPPVRPQLLPDEARFTLRLALLAGGAELAAWAWIVAAPRPVGALVAALRLSRFAWARLGVSAPRPLIAFALLFVALGAQGASLVAGPLWAGAACGLCALGELCASAVGDAVTVERRPAAFAWLDVGQAIGVALGIAVGSALSIWAPAIAAAGLLAGSVGVLDLRDRGTPRSAWPLRVYFEALRAPLGVQLSVLAFFIGAAGAFAARGVHGWLAFGIPLLGMGLAARLEPRMLNAVALPRALALVAVAGAACVVLGRPALAPSFGLIALGGAATALPASIARAGAELLRAPTSGLVWSALALGAGVGSLVL